MKNFFRLCIVIFCIFCCPTFAFEKMAGEVISISQPTDQDLYVAWDNLDISTILWWDFLGAGGTISLNNEVKQDAFVAGGTIFVRASVGDDLRVAGGNIYILSEIIWWDLIIAGGNVEIPEWVTIKWDLLIMGGNIKLGWNVNGKVEIHWANLFLNSNINWNTIIDVEKLSLGTNAKIKGNLNYTLPEKNEWIELITDWTKHFTPGSIAKSTWWNDLISGKDTQKIFWSVVAALTWYHFLFLFLFGVIFFYLFPGYLKKVWKVLSEKPRNMGLKWLLIFVLLPIACIFLSITLIWLPFAGIVFAWFLFFIILYELLCVVIFSHMLRDRFFSHRKQNTVTILLQLLIITFLSIIFTLINGADLLAWFFALGAVATYNWKILKDKLV